MSINLSTTSGCFWGIFNPLRGCDVVKADGASGKDGYVTEADLKSLAKSWLAASGPMERQIIFNKLKSIFDHLKQKRGQGPVLGSAGNVLYETWGTADDPNIFDSHLEYRPNNAPLAGTGTNRLPVHSGIEHKGGVHKGGTFIIVYEDIVPTGMVNYGNKLIDELDSIYGLFKRVPPNKKIFHATLAASDPNSIMIYLEKPAEISRAVLDVVLKDLNRSGKQKYSGKILRSDNTHAVISLVPKP